MNAKYVKWFIRRVSTDEVGQQAITREVFLEYSRSREEKYRLEQAMNALKIPMESKSKVMQEIEKRA